MVPLVMMIFGDRGRYLCFFTGNSAQSHRKMSRITCNMTRVRKDKPYITSDREVNYSGYQ